MNLFLLTVPQIIYISAASFLAFILLAFFITAYVCYRMAFKVKKRNSDDLHFFPLGEQFDAIKGTLIKMVDEADKIPYEDVYITTKSNFKLHGRYYHTKDGAPLQIMFHGYKGHPIRDFSGGLNYALNNGFNVLLIDQRAHGKSDGRCLTFGIKERLDCKLWAEYATKRFGHQTKIILTGISMGAATVMMAADLDLPKSVCAIIADSGYSSPKEIITKTIKEMKLPAKIFYPFVRIGGIIYGGFDVEQTDAVTAIKGAKVPVFFIHGEEDRFVPCEMSLKCYNVCPSPKQLSTFKGAGHGLSYVVQFEEYDKRAQEFYKKHILE